MQLTYFERNYETSHNSPITSIRVPPVVCVHRLKSTGTEDWMVPIAFLHEVVMKVPAPVIGTPTVQTVGNRFTHRSIPKAQNLECRKRNIIRQELQNVKTRVTLPSHIYTTRCGSFFTRIRAHVTTPRYCTANIPIYIRLLYHFTARTTHGYCYITITTFLFSAVTFYVSHSVP